MCLMFQASNKDKAKPVQSLIKAKAVNQEGVWVKAPAGFRFVKSNQRSTMFGRGLTGETKFHVSCSSCWWGLRTSFAYTCT